MRGLWRIVYNIIIGLAVLLAPWWALVVVLVLFAVFVPTPYELLGWGLVVDSLYGFGDARFLSVGFFTWAAALVFIFSVFIKNRLLAYNR